MKVSVVIVSKNRSKDLSHCLASLASQSINLDQLVLIDNNSNDETSKVFYNFSKKVSFNCKYVLDKSKGYPAIYNRGLKEAKYDWVAFIDDDCVANHNWFSSIKSFLFLKKNKKVNVLIGNSKTYYKNNIYSLLTNFKDKIWKDSKISKDKVWDYEILDNKNIVYDKKFLLENNLSFDESRSKEMNGASEDCDLGMQLQKAGAVAKYDKKMLVSHKDPGDFFNFYRKIFFSTLGHLSYEKKWNCFREAVLKKQKKLSIIKYIKSFFRENNLVIFKKIYFLLNLFFMTILVKGIKFYVKVFK